MFYKRVNLNIETMLSALNTAKYPSFDISEIISELDVVFKSFQSTEPAKAGDLLPDFSLQKDNSRWMQFLNGEEIQAPILLNQLFNKPLVVGFYSHYWQQHGLDLLQQLNNIQHDIKTNGGNLLIISSEKDRTLEKIVWDNTLSLSFYFDKSMEIAEKLRIYSENDPIWNRFSGIDINVPLLATYVISPAGQIEYDHIDLDFSKSFPAKDIKAIMRKLAKAIK